MADITVYGADGCADCRRSKRYLEENAVVFDWIDLEDEPAAIDEVTSRNDGRRVIPTIVFPDGAHLAEPSNQALGEKLGIAAR